jgi:hypothetical protein
MEGILRLVLCGHDTWSHTLRAEHQLRLFKNGLLRKTGPKREEVTGSWKQLCKRELGDGWSLLYAIRMRKSRMRWSGRVAQIEAKKLHAGFYGGIFRKETV